MAERGQRKDKLIREALMLAAKRVCEGDLQGRTNLAVAAEAVVAAAAKGDLPAFKELADRLDGRAIQATESQVDINVTHVDARNRLGRKLHAIVDGRTEIEPVTVTH